MKTLGSMLLLTGLVACNGAAPLGPEPTRYPASASMSSGDLSNRGPTTQAIPYRRILCFGDSLTYGTTSRTLDGRAALAMVEGYVPKLERLLIQEYGEGIELINSGLGGETSTEGLDRLGSEVRVFQPDLVLLLHGIVDVNNPLPRFPVVRSNLSEMMRVVLRHNSAVIIGTYPLLNPEGFRIQGIDNIPRLNDVIRQEAKTQNVPIADHEKDWNGDLTMQGPDGLHPNDNGYEKMAETWFNRIKELVEAAGT